MRKTAQLGMILALAIVLGYVETLIPIYIGIPGVKLGLANMVVLYLLYTCSWKEAVIISFLRILIIGFLFGNLFSIGFGVVGASGSILVMCCLRHFGFHCITVSIVGGIAHNIGQILVAIFLVQTYQLLYYLPVLFVAGSICGAIIGSLAYRIMKRLSVVYRAKQ